ncbi:MAG: NADH-quinone oxidoreductase subunit J [Candidatus Marinimicrobia bacterium]|jgi:NADH-quinone oxidoreductase subunit J|nr:NADH-quinone oxidoreductase subunit J [Candidatus Neomarinimicrobiota bacterium]MBT3501857.1 NADH-quinone oxidoreductase subunit J [Candidatus Neomarinimicrobiota bacterium]MBT3838617.1 NADH-quinone oxidoreductase subunit J [Candidatus Neomarinimicrobiota bacterium]MBT3999769.1 NADH-quinone oxidoreductase subunit J [Candidatus Neomarinimicrobiota bacterium]MBT4578638.1 NADH-quinone oxidoreductase subunit J [Candidatus Neomarinimicrobiota bacterium]
MVEFTFWFVVSLTLISAAIVVLSNQLIYSAMALLFTLFGVAGIYIFLWADFMAGVQILVYIGGILVLIIFGIMLTNRISSVRLSQTNMQQGIGGSVAIWLFLLISLVISKTSWFQVEAVEPVETVSGIGTLLLTKYLLPFEAISLLLLGALIGAALLSRKEN